MNWKSHSFIYSIFFTTMSTLLILTSKTSNLASAYHHLPFPRFLSSLVSSASSSSSSHSRSFNSLTRKFSSTSNSNETPPSSPSQTTTQDNGKPVDMQDIVSLCKRRGFVYPSSDIYGGFSGFYDYGPLGSLLKQNIKAQFLKKFVQNSPNSDIVLLDSSTIHHPDVWKASGHTDNFCDPMVDCKVTKLRFRADQLFYSKVTVASTGADLGYACVQEGPIIDMTKQTKPQIDLLVKSANLPRNTPTSPLDFTSYHLAPEDILPLLPSPSAPYQLSLTPIRNFNLMFQTNIGATSPTVTSYLRPETAQGIFINFKNVLTSSRLKIPFGIAQIGKAYRNEITPRNFVFRSREFEQMEIEYFIPPGEIEVWGEYYDDWIQRSMDFIVNDCGVRKELVDYDVHAADGLAHYARACTDIRFKFPFGNLELMGIAARGDYDLQQHAKVSGKSMEYYDETNKVRYVPHCIEPSVGVDRLFLAIMCSAYCEEDGSDGKESETRSVLRLHPSIAPVKVSVLPLVKNKEEIVGRAREVYERLRRRWNVEFDSGGAIGRRYRRADEIGTPFCVTVDFESLVREGEEMDVTVRFRDSMKQVRMKVGKLEGFLGREIDGY